MRRVHSVLNQFVDSDDEVGGVVPVEVEVDIAFVVFVYSVEYLLAERRQQHHRAFGQELFGGFGKVEHVQFACAVHGDDQVEMFALLDACECLSCRLCPCERGRVAQVKFGILLCNLDVYSSVFLKGKTVVVVADQKNAPDALLHQRSIVALFHLKAHISTRLQIYEKILTFASFLSCLCKNYKNICNFEKNVQDNRDFIDGISKVYREYIEGISGIFVVNFSYKSLVLL